MIRYAFTNHCKLINLIQSVIPVGTSSHVVFTASNKGFEVALRGNADN